MNGIYDSQQCPATRDSLYKINTLSPRTPCPQARGSFLYITDRLSRISIYRCNVKMIITEFESSSDYSRILTHEIDELVACSLGDCDFHLEVPLAIDDKWDFLFLDYLYRTRDPILFIIIFKKQ